jgi:hypothetical protein
MINFKVFSKHITEKVDGNFSAGDPAGPAAGSFIFNPGSSISSFGKAGFNPKTANSKDNPMNQYFAANMRTRDTHMQTTVDLLAATPGLMPQAIYKAYMTRKSGENPPPPPLRSTTAPPQEKPLSRTPILTPFLTPPYAPDWDPAFRSPIDLDPKPKPFGLNPDDDAPIAPRPGSRQPQPKPKPFGQNPGDDAPIAPAPKPPPPPPLRSTRISSKSASKTSSQPLTFSQLLQNLKGIKANRVSKSYN